MNYEEDLAIDASILDVECVDQPMLVIKYAKISAEADLAVDNAKERLDLIKAELDNKIRTNPDKFGIEKITEAVVQNTILMQQKYKDTVAEYLQAKHEAKIIAGAIKAVDHRKSMLENLVRLHGQQYFAGPSLPHDLSAEWQRKHEQKKSNTSVQFKMNRTKK